MIYFKFNDFTGIYGLSHMLLKNIKSYDEFLFRYNYGKCNHGLYETSLIKIMMPGHDYTDFKFIEIEQ